MRVLVVGSGGVGAAIARGCAESDAFEPVVLADLSAERAQAAATRSGGANFEGVALDASDTNAISELARARNIDVIVNACDPRLNPPIFAAAYESGCHYLDMAMTISAPGVLLGAEQFAVADAWADREQLALVGMGVEPGLSDVFARYAADHLFATIDEIGVRDGDSLTIEGYAFAPTFSIWTTIEECLNPPYVYERGRGVFTTEPFSEPELFAFPGGIGPLECVNVEHEEVVLIPRHVDCNRVTFKYGLATEFIEVLRMLDKTGLASTTPVKVGAAEVSPRDVVAAVLPDPATLGDRMRGSACAGTWVTGTGRDGNRREVYLHYLSDNAETMRKHDAQVVVWQTGINAVVALEMLASGAWSGAGVHGPEAFDAVPFLDCLRAKGEEWAIDER